MINTPKRLDDIAMQRFIREGYIILHPDFSADYHEGIYQQIEAVFEKGGNPGNNLLPRVPDLMQIFDHPLVNGALQSILGHDYYLHLHRHVHDRPPGGKDQNMHKDSLGNSRFAVDEKRRQHHTRWAMLFYYPQDTPVELGPTAVIPKSQYLNNDWPVGEEELALSGPAGTVVIVHYDMLHRGMANCAETTRHMVKFLFTRMSEPSTPSWDYQGTSWPSNDAPQDIIWQHMWDWHCGVDTASRLPSSESIEQLMAYLNSDQEIESMRAAYELGLRGSVAVPALIEALDNGSEAVQCNAGYALTSSGAAAVPALLAAVNIDNERVRARVLDILGDIGLPAAAAVPDLVKALEDVDDDPRQRAAEALGTVAQGSNALANSLAQVMGQDSNGEVRRNAALSLARLGLQTTTAVDALTRGMTDKNHYVRGFSVHGLERIGTPNALRAALQHLQTMRWDGV